MKERRNMWKVGQPYNLGNENSVGHRGLVRSDPNYPHYKDHIAFVVKIEPNTKINELELGQTLKTHPFRVTRRCSCGFMWDFAVEEADISGD